MARESIDKRARLVGTAVRLAHEQGFHRTSLADIARDSGVPLGNVYYYFRTKEALGDALVDALAEHHAALRRDWDRLPTAKARLVAFVRETVSSRDVLARSGCPIGTLCAELHKEGGPLAERASELFAELLRWAEAQLRSIGRGSEAPGLAAHLLASLQGASLLAHTFHDPRYVAREARLLERWIESL